MISLFALGYFYVEAKQAAIRSVIRPFALSERPPQPQNVKAPATGGEEKSDESAKATNVYAETTSTKVSEQLADVPERVYIPNVADATVDVIDPKTFQVVDQYAVGEIPHHVTPSWDMKKLYVNNEASSSLTVIDPKSGKPTRIKPLT